MSIRGWIRPGFGSPTVSNEEQLNKLTTIALSVVLSASAAFGSVVLKETPIQNSLRQELSWSASSDEFGGDKDSDEGRTAETRVASATSSKSTTRAVLYSALLPGWGEHYLGQKGKARFFFAAEAISWIGLATFKTYEKWKKDDMIRFARERAGADLEGKDDFFIDMVGFYNDIDEYNSLGRAGDPDRPYLHDTESNHWRWRTDGVRLASSDRSAFRHMKNRSRSARRTANFMIGLMVVNRIISVIDTIRDSKRAQRVIDSDWSATNVPAAGENRSKLSRLNYRLEIDPLNYPGQVGITLYSLF